MGSGRIPAGVTLTSAQKDAFETLRRVGFLTMHVTRYSGSARRFNIRRAALDGLVRKGVAKKSVCGRGLDTYERYELIEDE